MNKKYVRKIAVFLLITGSALGLAYEFLYAWNMYHELLNTGGSRVSHHYISGPLWRELIINLATPAFACSVAFYLLRERYHEKTRQCIKYCFYAICIWFAVAILFVIISAFLTNKKATSDTVSPPAVESPVSKEQGDIREHQIQVADWQYLIEKGLRDPISDLVQDLMKHNELIPCEGSLGGTPRFNNPDRIAVLSKDVVIADYDDGHVDGTIELSFIVSNSTISWKVVHAECGN